MSDYRWRIQNLARESIDEYITGAGLFGYVLIALWVPLLPVICRRFLAAYDNAEKVIRGE